MAPIGHLAVRLERGEPVDIRGDGKAGGGLVLALQTFAAALTQNPDLAVETWPLFSSARRGANVRSFLRVARGQVEAVCQVLEPDVVLLMNEAAAEEIDFAEGTANGLYVVNTRSTPAEIAAHYRLGGTVATIAGDDLGLELLGRPLGNVPVLAALVRATRLIDPDTARRALTAQLGKRRVPSSMAQANLALFDRALDQVRCAELPPVNEGEHARPAFRGYGALPTGGQSPLRTSHANRTAGYGRPGVQVEFSDPTLRCNGCTLCVVQCPEGIIDFVPDPARGAIVRGAAFSTFCKVCRECVTACPLDLFREVAVVARPAPGTLEGA